MRITFNEAVINEYTYILTDEDEALVLEATGKDTLQGLDPEDIYGALEDQGVDFREGSLTGMRFIDGPEDLEVTA